MDMVNVRMSRGKKYLSASLSVLFPLAFGFMAYDFWQGMGWKIAARYRMEREKNQSRRMLVLGDSFLARWNLEHCLQSDITQYCDANDIGLLNAAMPGYGPLEYAERIRANADFKPTLVLIFYFVGNDLTDCYREAPRSQGTPPVHLIN